ncbi:peptidase M50 [Streptomyces lonarensis]|uniref:Peptidase M50 n=1 Tax=Streptomyces lonarensis TaxID=700599 RepID=A0A7X6D3L2_9ACTN|nr:peptidase M50 [Streptomyces lonarensis]NJQ07567.1 peptidase M50 [Streptomyces lonarensis]
MSGPATTAGGAGAAAEYRPRLRESLLVGDPVLHGARTVHLVKDPDSGRSFELGVKEHFLVSRMDGTRTLQELGADYAAAYGKRLGDGHWGSLLSTLGSRGLLDGSPAPAPAEEQPERTNGLLSGSVRMVADAPRTAARLHAAVRPLLSRPAVVVLLLASLAPVAAVAARFADVAAGTARTFTEPAMLFALVALVWLSTALHELAHGVTAHHAGGRVGEIGLRWRLPVVIMYCTVEDFAHLPSTGRRVAVAVAGAVVNLLFLLPFLALWLLAPLDGLTADLLAALLLIGVVQALMMLLPIPPLDGYKIVEQWTHTAQLAASARTWMMLRVRRDPAATAYPARARRVYGGYVALVFASLAVLATGGGLLVHALLTAT